MCELDNVSILIFLWQTFDSKQILVSSFPIFGKGWERVCEVCPSKSARDREGLQHERGGRPQLPQTFLEGGREGANEGLCESVRP